MKRKWIKKLQYREVKLEKMLRGGKRLNNNVSLFKTLEEVSGHGGEPPQMEKCIEL